ncbi:MAG: hypothetical protein Kow0063_34590 [Anaerolineae bacterium]
MNNETQGVRQNREKEEGRSKSGVGDLTAQTLSIRMGNARDVKAETVDITQGVARQVEGANVTLRQAGAQSVVAENVVIRQGGVLKAQAEHMEISQGGVALVRAQAADLTASRVGVALSRGDVTMDQAAARAVLTTGEVTMDQSGTVAMIARSVKARNCGTVLLLANRVEGEVNTAFGPRESAVFGVAAGVVISLALLVGRLIRRRGQ